MYTEQKKGKKIYILEAIRGFAAVYVAAGHLFAKNLVVFGKDISIFFRFGQEAVVLFFLLSGFVIRFAYITSSDKSFKTFFIKRFLRIYIPLIFVFAANYILVVIEKNQPVFIDWRNLAGNLLMLQDMSSLKPNVICDPFLGNAPLWSLSYEWWFYMIFIFIMAYIKKDFSVKVYLVAIVSSITYLIIPNFFNRELMYLSLWWIGADMASLYVAKAEISFLSLRKQLTAILIIISILVLNVYLHRGKASFGVSPFLEFRHFLSALIFILLALLWHKCRWVGFSKTIGLFEPIASISFGIYISHYFLIANAHYLDKFIASKSLLIISYTILCLLFSYLIERIIYPRIYKFTLGKFSSANSKLKIV